MEVVELSQLIDMGFRLFDEFTMMHPSGLSVVVYDDMLIVHDGKKSFEFKSALQVAFHMEA